MEYSFGSMLGWVAAACAMGFATSAVFAGRLKLSRRLFLVPYVLLSGAFLIVFAVWNRVDLASVLRRNWAWGILAGGIGQYLPDHGRPPPAGFTADARRRACG